MIYSEELRVALEAVKKASSVCKEIRMSDACEDAVSKKDRSPVTIADFGAQAVIIEEILNVYPESKIVAEEDSAQMQELKGSVLGKQMVAAVSSIIENADWDKISDLVAKGNYEGGPEGRFWTIDPIDGTKGFLRNEQYAVALSLIENGVPVLGVLGCPNYPVDSFESSDPEVGMLFFAERGKGSWQVPLCGGDPLKIAVESISSASDAKLCESVESGHSSHSESARIKNELGITKESLRIDSQCKYAAVAKGDASIYLRLPTSEEYREKIWDHAAGYIVNLEAGGMVRDIHGNDLDFSKGFRLESNQGVIAAPESIFAEVLKAVRQ